MMIHSFVRHKVIGTLIHADARW